MLRPWPPRLWVAFFMEERLKKGQCMNLKERATMKGHARDLIFLIAMILLTFFHVDFWAWEKVHPMLLGWIPYHLWYDGGLTLLGALFFFWWGRRGWPDPPKDWEEGG